MGRIGLFPFDGVIISLCKFSKTSTLSVGFKVLSYHINVPRSVYFTQNN